jgi:hypothetical protein
MVSVLRDATQKVTQTFTRLAPSYRTLTTELESIYVTDEHPLWVQGKGWTPAKEIKEDDVVAGRQGDMLILENALVAKSAQVYNFSVYRTHSYFVGEAGLWAHNIICPNPYLIKGVAFVVDKDGFFTLNGYKLPAEKWLENGELKWINPIRNKPEVFKVLDKVHVDHIFPQKAIKEVNPIEWEKLPKSVQDKLLNDPDNLQPMLGKANCSKGCKVEGSANEWDTWTINGETKKIDPNYKKTLQAQQEAMRQKVLDAIKANQKG